jgi:hypothetical protein
MCSKKTFKEEIYKVFYKIKQFVFKKILRKKCEDIDKHDDVNNKTLKNNWFKDVVASYWVNDPRNVGIRSPELYAIPKIDLRELIHFKDMESKLPSSIKDNDINSVLQDKINRILFK